MSETNERNEPAKHTLIATDSPRDSCDDSENKNTRPGRLATLLGGHGFGRLMLYGIAFLIVSFLLRATLGFISAGQVDTSPMVLVKTFLMGFLYDIVAFCYLAAVASLLMLAIPRKLQQWRVTRVVFDGLFILALFVLLFDAVAEVVFWDEFSARFNFIAVDYLVYTTEVLGNIWESYPVVPLVIGVATVAGVLGVLGLKLQRRMPAPTSGLGARAATAVFFCAVATGSYLLVDNSMMRISVNQNNNEMAGNGMYCLIAAFRDSTLNYPQFYLTEDNDAAFRRLRRNLAESDAEFLSDDIYDITRLIKSDGPPQRHNVVFIVVESLSAEFMSAFYNRQGITPYLDELADNSLFFSNMYATGTRTTRGLEAISLSLPPTPGRSLVKRPDNAGLFSIGTVFKHYGYDCKFLYGGYGYFDNMNGFFAGNGFTIVDRASIPDDRVTFSNAWGVCDQDLYRTLLSECDKSYAAGSPFCMVTMTTSNHRPYTYPQVIDMPSGQSRSGAVKYSDYAIGELIDRARDKPWFDDTLFVIVADHCARSAGRVEVPVELYRIPLIVYGPKIVQPARVEKLASQIDVAPTVFGLLKFTYVSRFFGRNLLAEADDERALLGNYQKLGVYDGKTLELLLPQKTTKAYEVWSYRRQFKQTECPESTKLRQDAISYYQCAAYLFSHDQLGQQQAEKAAEKVSIARAPATD